jgi:small subunit ribosomal protein S7
MSRRASAKKRPPTAGPDPIYRSRLVSMMISRLLIDGKKNLAARLFYDSLDHIRGLQASTGSSDRGQAGAQKKVAGSGSLKTGTGKGNDSFAQQDGKEIQVSLAENSANSADALKLFQQAIVNVTPVVEVKSRRVGGSNFQVPLEVSSERGTALALKWIVQAARQRPGREMAVKLANELMDASNKTGNAIRKREETHKNAEANKAFANYRF